MIYNLKSQPHPLIAYEFTAESETGCPGPKARKISKQRNKYEANFVFTLAHNTVTI